MDIDERIAARKQARIAKGTPLLKTIAEISAINIEELRFIKLDDDQVGDLLNELERAQYLLLDGSPLLGVRIDREES